MIGGERREEEKETTSISYHVYPTMNVLLCVEVKAQLSGISPHLPPPGLEAADSLLVFNVHVYSRFAILVSTFSISP